jgi:orotidine-5'-phosphate decarboxylase
MSLRDRLPQRSILPSCDVDLVRFESIVRETSDLHPVGGYKIGAQLALSVGLSTVMRVARRYTEKPIIYDHQKAGTDIPDTAEAFMDTLAEAGVDAVILFPFAGPASQRAWMRSAVAHGLDVIVGAHISQPNFLSEDGGYIPQASVDKIFAVASADGINDFVAPGNDLKAILRISAIVATGTEEPVFFIPGLISQGGSILDLGPATGGRWHAIIGRAIYERTDVRSAVQAIADEFDPSAR